ncbi:DUF445 family protein [Brevibacillus fulvus]|uniref:Uncharacterized membrane protein YheB (UPF0754 family) n=1 Tax=Brevibacillus fulvus TaxID=1125967 RepID=A0A939BW10_9BACL|nr:DUF445 family protein [Brevibacillus fulvus]MBM7591301.1 uncharacterized membrane protein YheB (UPF0754 family) [Brevibacillus fulvus]
MNSWLLLVVNVVIGSLIGGLTNELAIRMLFRPYKAIYLGKWRVPFTPGLLPRRREEISVQMGRLVETHLLTTEGIKRAIAEGNFEQSLAAWMNGQVDKWAESPRTIRSLVQQWWPEILTEDEQWHPAIRQPLQRRWNELADSWLRQFAGKPLRDVLPPDLQTRLDELLDNLGQQLLMRLRHYLQTPEGQRTVQELVRSMLSGGGGMLGGLVGMFLGEDKISAKLLPYLDETLRNQALAGRVSAFLKLEAQRLLDKPTDEILQSIGAEQLTRWQEQLFVKLEQQSVALTERTVGELLSPVRQQLNERLIPQLAAWAIGTVQQNLEPLFQRLSIKEIVMRQVEQFPLERLEEMILGISGKEFRMITVLGFLLGGLIGIVQGLLLLLV